MTDNDPQENIPVGETYAWQPQPSAAEPTPYQPNTPSPAPYDPQSQWSPQPSGAPQQPSEPQPQWNQQPAPYQPAAPYNPSAGYDPSSGYDPAAGRGAPAPGAPGDQWYPPGPGTTYTPNVGGLPPGGMTPPSYVAEQPKKKRGKLIAALGTVVVLVAAGTFAVVQLTGDSNDGGAATPEAAVQSFFTSVNKADALGALDMMLPGERATLLQPMKNIATQLQRIEVLDKSADLSKIGGFDINVKLTSVKADIVNGGSGGDGDIADVTIVGSASATIDGSKVPIGSLLTDNGVTVGDASADETSFDSSKSGDGSVLTAVKKDGRWYVSLFYSIAESARIDAKQDVPKLSDAVKPAGADTPQKAMDAFLTAVTSANAESIIASLDPNEAEALQRYAPLFLDDAKGAIDDAKNNFSVDITDTSYTVNKIDGNHVGIIPKTLNATVTSKNSDGDEETTTIEINDGCVKVTSKDQTQNSCEIDDSQINDTVQNEIPFGGDPAKLTTLIDDLNKSFDDLSVKGITMTQVGGKWFVSPIGTTLNITVDVLKALDKTEVQTIIDDIKALSS